MIKKPKTVEADIYSCIVFKLCLLKIQQMYNYCNLRRRSPFSHLQCGKHVSVCGFGQPASKNGKAV